MIDISEDERMQAFTVWLRTGRLPTVQGADGIVLKFNPWHDPETGRFTFRGAGRSYGRSWGGGGFTRGGGGSFGGGGASGRWGVSDAAKHAKAKPRSNALPAAGIIVARPAQPSKPATSLPPRAAKPARVSLSRVVRNGYEYRMPRAGGRAAYPAA